MQSNYQLIVLTPVKNEAWILPTFLRATSIWADYIIISDQGSTDGSREIAQSFPNVILIDNSALKGFNDFDVRNPLVLKSRELPGEHILFFVDADEILSPDFDSEEWHYLINLPKGSQFDLYLRNIYPGFFLYGKTDYSTAVGFVDDGRETVRNGIILGRWIFPLHDNDIHYIAKSIYLLHYQFVDWGRMESKHRWYQCFERIHYPEKSVIDIYRRYHWMYNKKMFSQKLDNKWIENYLKLGVDITDVVYDHNHWWDDIVQNYIKLYSSSYFRRIDTSCPQRMDEMGRKSILVSYLNLTKYIYNNKGILSIIVRKMDTFLKTRFGL